MRIDNFIDYANDLISTLAKGNGLTRFKKIRYGFAVSALLCLLSCSRYEYSSTDEIGLPVISDGSNIVFYRVRTDGTVKYRTSHSPGEYTASNRKYDIIKYDFDSSEAKVVAQINGMKLLEKHDAPMADLLLSYQSNWLSKKYQITPSDCNSYQLKSGLVAFRCDQQLANSKSLFGFAESLGSRHIISDLIKQHESEAVRLGNISNEMFSNPRFEFIPKARKIVLYGSNPLGGTYGGGPWRYLVQLVDLESGKSIFHQLQVDASTYIAGVEATNGELQFLVAPLVYESIDQFSVLEITGSGAQNLVTKFEYNNSGNSLYKFAFVPQRREVYFMGIEGEAIKLIQYNYISKSTVVVPVQ